MKLAFNKLFTIHYYCMFIASVRNSLCTSPTLVRTAVPAEGDCVSGPFSWYRGTRNFTKSGIACQRWDATVPHTPKKTPKDQGGRHNFCRSPDNDGNGVWCYTTSPSKRWDYCDIRKCYDDSKVVWTNFDDRKQHSKVVWTHADPEIVKQYTNHNGGLNISVIRLANQPASSEYWALAGDYHRNLLFFTDYRAEYLGIHNLQLNTTIRKFEGMAHGIESLAYDWVTENLYWTDSKFKWIMTVDKTYQYYTPIYRSNRDPPYGLALHAKQRKLFFALYKLLDSKIYVADLAGKNRRLLFSFPQIFDVTGLTVDYTDDRLYWTDFTGFGGIVWSSKLDGTDQRKQYHEFQSVFWGITSYMEYLYVTDLHPKYRPLNLQPRKYFTVWVIPKSSTNVLRYKLSGKPRGITVLSKNEEQSFDIVNKTGECAQAGLPECEHICLPRINADRECTCSLGFQLVDGHKCKAMFIPDEFMLVADYGQERIFQIPFNYSDQYQKYSVVYPIRETVTSIATDISSSYVYWSNERQSLIQKSSVHEEDRTKFLVSNVTRASYMLVDSCTKNLFFVDSHTQAIKVMSHDGQFLKTLLQHNLTKDDSPSIQIIAQDWSSRKLYWSDTKSKIGNGQIWRMNYNGKEQELVFKNLTWPRAITVDAERGSLFIGEATTGMIYEVALSDLNTITNTSIQNVSRQYDLAGIITQLNFFILQLEVHNGILYFIDGRQKRLQKFNLTLGPASISSFGPHVFFSVTSISIFSQRYQAKNVDCHMSACMDEKASNGTRCGHICVDDPGHGRACLCDDHYVLVGLEGVKCLNHSLPNLAPDYGNTCPHDMELQMSECAEYLDTDGLWEPPKWTDDHTPSHELTISKFQDDHLHEGVHEVRYTATDWHGESGVCRFQVTVVVARCGEHPTLPADLVMTQPMCKGSFGPVYNISCVDRDKMVVFGGNEEDFIINFCAESSQWTPLSRIENVTCAQRHLDHARGLPTGPMIAIIVVVFLLAIAVVTMSILSIRNRPYWQVMCFKISTLCKRKTDENHAEMSNRSDLPYTIIT